MINEYRFFFFFSSRRRHTRWPRDWSSDVCSSDLPDFREYAVPVAKPGTTFNEATRVLGAYLRDVIRENPTRFRLFGPDETASNRLSPVFEATRSEERRVGKECS